MSRVGFLIGRLLSGAPMHGRLTPYVKWRFSHRISTARKVTVRSRRLPAHRRSSVQGDGYCLDLGVGQQFLRGLFGSNT